MATIGDGKLVELGRPLTLLTGNYASFQTAWEQFAKHVGAPLPDELATPRTVIGIPATNRQPSKKHAFAVSID